MRTVKTPRTRGGALTKPRCRVRSNTIARGRVILSVSLCQRWHLIDSDLTVHTFATRPPCERPRASASQLRHRLTSLWRRGSCSKVVPRSGQLVPTRQGRQSGCSVPVRNDLSKWPTSQHCERLDALLGVERRREGRTEFAVLLVMRATFIVPLVGAARHLCSGRAPKAT
jgi:hypothetical protein